MTKTTFVFLLDTIRVTKTCLACCLVLLFVVMLRESLSPLRLSPREGLDFVWRPKIEKNRRAAGAPKGKIEAKMKKNGAPQARPRKLKEKMKKNGAPQARPSKKCKK